MAVNACPDQRQTQAALRRWRLGLLGLLAGCWLLGASAHPLPETRVWLDTTPDGLRLTAFLPLNRLEYAYGHALTERPDQLLPAQADGLSRYLLQHVGARNGDTSWQVLRPQLQVLGQDASAELQAVMDLRAPPGADRRQLTLLFDAITHEVRSHRVQVFLRQDWAAGQVGGPPQPLGELDTAHRQLSLSLAPPRAGASWWRLLREGAWHIASGADHLAFLLMLLLVAPLRAEGTRWQGLRPLPDALRHLGAVVTAFTAGHALTLVLGSSGLWLLPSRAVELGVAATVALAACQACRPLWGRHEALLAGLFGTCHGLAFAASLSGAGLGIAQHAQALLAFNLGVEAWQLLMVALVVPPLWLWARASPASHAWLRGLLGATGLLAAGLWLVERSGALGDWQPLGDADGLLQATPWALAALWLTALTLQARARRSPPPALRPSRPTLS